MLVSPSLRPPVTLRPSFSFYVSASNVGLILRAADFGDSVTIVGKGGPSVIRTLRRGGFQRPVLFDGQGYKTDGLDPAEWVASQRNADADRCLLPGVFVPWDAHDNAPMVDQIKIQADLAHRLDATVLVAIDSRWLAHRSTMLVDEFNAAGVPVALVLANRADPLGDRRAVEGLRMVGRHVPQISVLRCDHGGLALPAFGGAHVSFGLTTTHRHFATPSMNPRRVFDNSARVFIRDILDWFRASEIAGWLAAGPSITCFLPCCAGSPLERFFDPQENVVEHNMTTLADFADYILDADPAERANVFTAACNEAVSLYGLAGFRGPEKPKAQLTSWVFL